MARCRVVAPEMVRLSLSDGDWLDVKAELTAGEQRRVFTGLVKSMNAGEKPELNPEQVGKTKILAYVLGWSLLGLDGKVMAFNEGALDSIDPASYAEIMEAVDKHDEAAEKAREERKNGRGGKVGSIATLPSVDSSLVGATTT